MNRRKENWVEEEPGEKGSIVYNYRCKSIHNRIRSYLKCQTYIQCNSTLL